MYFIIELFTLSSYNVVVDLRGLDVPSGTVGGCPRPRRRREDPGVRRVHLSSRPGPPPDPGSGTPEGGEKGEVGGSTVRRRRRGTGATHRPTHSTGHRDVRTSTGSRTPTGERYRHGTYDRLDGPRRTSSSSTSNPGLSPSRCRPRDGPGPSRRVEGSPTVRVVGVLSRPPDRPRRTETVRGPEVRPTHVAEERLDPSRR